ncbi:MAG: NAD(P)H-hydrate dehydratase [Ruminococcaceae bacterium]|nr:NAD(P)H-hydrate dehydratase [Oscillospiraceae bacterium]
MKLVTATQMQALEQLAIEQFGISGTLLMENAARSFIEVLQGETGPVAGKEIAVFCGKGNNGGDGFAIARHLHNRGAQVTVIAGFSPEQLKQDAALNFEIITRMGLEVLPLAELGGRRFSLVIDALFGTGFHGEPKEGDADMIRAMNQSGATVVAVDMPSGTSAEDGGAAEVCVRADLTITFAAAKLGQFLYPAKAFVGKIIVADISIPREVLLTFPTPYRTLDEGLAEKLPPRPENSHKGSFGKVLLFAGSPGMSGACMMAGGAALKTGAGMVTAAVPRQLADGLSARVPEMMTLALPCEGESLSKTAGAVLKERLQVQDVLLAGCGLGSGENTKKALLSVISECDKPMVIDADGINLLKGNIHVIKDKPAPVIMTPHPLEFSRISGHSMEKILQNRIGTAAAFAKEFKLTLVLKGADTVVAHPDGRCYICPVSNSGLATAGSGDVLSGIIASLLAQGAEAREAANLGVYIHSLAGLRARDRLGSHGMTATDIIAELPAVMKKLAGEHS